MAFFLILFTKLAPLYIMILMGYLAGKLLNVHRDHIIQILFFLVTPIIIFNAAATTPLNSNILSLPFLTFTVSTILCIGFYQLSKLIWTDSTKNLIGMSAGTGNTSYIGLPLALLLFDDQSEGIYVMALLGITLYENSVGFYTLAKGSQTALECLSKLIRLPALYAFSLGFAVNIAHLHLPVIFEDFMVHVKGAFIVLGMMVIGLGFASLHSFKLDFKFIGMTFFAKFAAWPLMMFAIIVCDKEWFGFFDQKIYDVLLLISIVPLAVNTVIFSSFLNNKSEQAITTLFLSTVFALVYTPFMAMHLIQEHNFLEIESADSAIVDSDSARIAE